MTELTDVRRRVRARRGRSRRDGGRLGAVVGLLGIVAVMLLAMATVLGRLLSAPPAFAAAAVAVLPFLYVGVAVLLFGAWAMVPDRRALPASLAVTVTLAAAIWGPSWSARPQATDDDGVPVRVMSWNLRRLWGGPDDGGDPHACAVREIEQHAPDVLALLEVSAHDVEKLERDLDMTCTHHAYLSTSGAKRGGLAACARGPWEVKSGRGLRFVDHVDWYYVFTEVQRRDRVFNLLAVHLSPYEYVAKKIRLGVRNLAQGDPNELQALEKEGVQIVRGQADQARALIERVARLQDPTVVAGDFNSTRDAALHASLRQHLTDTWEQGGQGLGGTVSLFGWLPLRIDYIYATEQLPVAAAALPEAGCSDHRPVLADLVLLPRQD